MQFHSFIEFYYSLIFLSILSGWVCFSPRTIASLYRHHSQSSFSLFSLVYSFLMSVTIRSDRCLHQNFFAEQSYCRHISSGGNTVPHHFQCVGVHSGTPLGIYGGVGSGRYRWVGCGGVIPSHIIICGQSPDRFYQTQVDARGVQHPHWFVRKCGYLYQCWEDDRDALPPLPCSWDPVGRAIWASDEWFRPHLPVPSEYAVSVPILWSGPGGRYDINAPPNPARSWPCSTVEDPKPPCERALDLLDRCSLLYFEFSLSILLTYECHHSFGLLITLELLNWVVLLSPYIIVFFLPAEWRIFTVTIVDCYVFNCFYYYFSWLTATVILTDEFHHSFGLLHTSELISWVVLLSPYIIVVFLLEKWRIFTVTIVDCYVLKCLYDSSSWVTATTCWCHRFHLK